MKKLKKLILFSVIGIVMIIFTILAIEAILARQVSGRMYSNIAKIPARETVIILGASVHANGELSPILKDRVDTAIRLYQAKKIKVFHVTGDHRTEDYNEVAAIVSYLKDHGITEDIITMDHAGLDTYDSMYRAGKLFDIESATVITQKFHLPRALFISKQLGYEYYGLAADQKTYQTEYRLKQREKLANIKALYEVLVNKEPSTMDYKLNSSAE